MNVDLKIEYSIRLIEAMLRNGTNPVSVDVGHVFSVIERLERLVENE